MAEGRVFYAEPQTLDVPTSGHCYTEKTQDGKRKMEIRRATGVLSLRGSLEEASDK